MFNLYIANPRGFCAGVTNAISSSNDLLKLIDRRPLYFYHEIVHNNYLTNDLIAKGAIFTNDINLVPDHEYCVFSAHGVSKEIEIIAARKNLKVVDLTCPLVHKVHKEALGYQAEELDLIYIGDPYHHESKGTLGRISSAQYYIIQNKEEIKDLVISDHSKLAYISQTTLNVTKVGEIVQALKEKFPQIKGANLNDICDATKNRQAALQKIINIHPIDLILVIGSNISSNSNKLTEVGLSNGINSYLIEDCGAIQIDWLKNIKNIALTAGASAPEILIDNVINFFKIRYAANIHNVNYIDETIKFHPPKILRDLKKTHSGNSNANN